MRKIYSVLFIIVCFYSQYSRSLKCRVRKNRQVLSLFLDSLHLLSKEKRTTVLTISSLSIFSVFAFFILVFLVPLFLLHLRVLIPILSLLDTDSGHLNCNAFYERKSEKGDKTKEKVERRVYVRLSQRRFRILLSW